MKITNCPSCTILFFTEEEREPTKAIPAATARQRKQSFQQKEERLVEERLSDSSRLKESDSSGLDKASGETYRSLCAS